MANTKYLIRSTTDTASASSALRCQMPMSYVVFMIEPQCWGYVALKTVLLVYSVSCNGSFVSHDIIALSHKVV
eukprot:scaffold183328_cov31-Prasinocladus_malaysianus.AAC.1